MRPLPVRRPWPAPRRLRARLVLGFGLTVAIVLAVLTAGERLILAHTMTDTLVQSLTVAARAGTRNPSGLSAVVTVGAGTRNAPGLGPGVLAGSGGSLTISGTHTISGTNLPPPVPSRPAQSAIDGMAQMALANLRQLAQALAAPDQPAAMLDTQGHLLTSQITATGDRLRTHPLARAVLADLVAAARPHIHGLRGPWHATVSTPDGAYVVVLWPSQLLVMEQIRPHAVRVLGIASGDVPGTGFPPSFLDQGTSSSLVVLLAAKLAATQHTLDMVTVISLGGALLALSLTVLLGLLVVNAALRPLATIAGAAEQLATGDYGYRLALDASTDEVGRLAATFNRMAEAIGAAFATQRRFLADASHELRTPLTALRGYSDVLLLKLRSDPDTAERLARAMQEDAVRMSRLVNDLLTLARLEGGLDLQCGPLILQELVTAAATEAKAITGGTHHITVDLPGTEIVLFGDRDRLRQVLSNMVGNACAYSPPGSHVVLRAYRQSGWAQIVVKDDGPGIAPEDLARLGERFFRGDTARSRQSGGTGLGVAIARGIVEAHGGNLTIQSTLGYGTTITINVPARPYSTS